MKCPRCSAAIATPADAAGHFVCSGCGIRLRRVPAKPEPAQEPKAEPSAAPAVLAEGEAIGADDLLAGLEAPAAPAPAKATLPPGTARKPVARDEEAGAARSDVLARILAELQTLRRNQERMLSLLRARASGPVVADEAPDGVVVPLPVGPDDVAAPLRSRQRKSVLLIDDDDATRQAAIEALERAEVPVRAVADGNSGLASLARERPDVLVIELGVGGAMPGKDVINLIKATMEWVDIPIVLYTRVPVADQREARTIHGADELVPKDVPDAAATLASQIVALFRKAAD